MPTYSPPLIGAHSYMFSIFVWGQFAKAIVFDYNRAGPYYRAYRIPYQPNTPSQVATRELWTNLQLQWDALTQETKLWWERRAAPRRMTGKNLFFKSAF